jgi:ABC-type Fe3+-hydroxamate transport system substrate-binding protein
MSLREFTDQMGHRVVVSFPPKRIVSLVPSQTELLAYLGLNDRVVGITKFCVHPVGWRTSKTIIGGTKKFDFEKIYSLKPDLIIGNKEENYPEGISRLKKELPVWMSDVITLDDARKMIQGIGSITGCENQAAVLIHQIDHGFQLIKKVGPFSVIYLIWKNPWMAAGRNTFIHTMLEAAGFRNAVVESRYPELTDDDLRQLHPDVILLSSEPYPFSEKHILALQHIVPHPKILLVDGEIFSWYGSRLLKFPEYLSALTLQLQ